VCKIKGVFLGCVPVADLRSRNHEIGHRVAVLRTRPIDSVPLLRRVTDAYVVMLQVAHTDIDVMYCIEYRINRSFERQSFVSKMQLALKNI
jgi:hypothetical protein